MNNNKVAVFRKVTFNAAHRLFNKNWSNDQNQKIFGLCANEHYHGHNYRLDVKVVGEIDPETGYVINLDELKQVIQQEVHDRFDHRNLNLDCPEFAGLNPTGENIVVVIYKLLRERLHAKYDLQVRLWETERNYFEFPA